MMLHSGFPMLIVWGADRTLLYNEAYAPILGERHTNALGRPFFSVWPEVEDAIAPVIDGAFDGKATFFEDLEVILVRSGTSQPAWFTFSYSPILDETGQVPGVLCICVETTRGVIAHATARSELVHRQAAERELRTLNDTLEQRVASSLEQRRLLADIVEGTDALILVVDLGFRVLAINKAAADEFNRVFGVCPKVGQSILEILDDQPIHREAVRGAWGRALGGEAYTAISEFGDPARGRRFYELKFNILHDSDGRQTGAYQFVYDVTDRILDQTRRIEAEAARYAADELHRAYFQNAADALFVIGVQPDGGFVVEQLNPAHEASIGFRLEEVRGKRLEDFLPKALLEPVLETYRQVVRTGEILQHRDVFDINGQQQHWDTSLVPVKDSQGRVVRLTGSSRNVTTQVVAEEMLRQSQKMEAVGQLTGGIAHDFNNLLAAIVGGFDLILRKPSDADRVRRLAVNGLAAAERGAKLTSQLLAFSRAQKIERKVVSLAPIVAGVRDLLQSTLGPQIMLHFDLADGDTSVMSDKVQLEMAVLNLAINARDAMSGGGDLTIRTSVREIVGDPELVPGPYVELAVSDTGIGMDDEVAARAFDPFFTTKGVGKGTGLGLSQVYGIAKQGGGAARIATSPGQGTTVTLLLPRSEAQRDSDQATSSSTPAIHRSAAKILVIDDDEDVRRVMADSIEALGFDVIEAADGVSGLRALERDVPDLVLVDFAMPDMNGAEVAEVVRRTLPNLPIIFVSGFSDTAAIERVVGGAMPMLRKPFRIDELQAMIVEGLRVKAS